MVRCEQCRLLQLEEGLLGATELAAIEPSAMVEQGRRAVADLVAVGFAAPGQTYASFQSPHGNGWQEHLAAAGLITTDAPCVDLVVDIFGLMHEADQLGALKERIDRVAADGRLVLQVHPIGVDIAHQAWYALRHGHYAYYSLQWLVEALNAHGMRVRAGWHYPLQGGTAVLVASRDLGRGVPGCDTIAELIHWEQSVAPVSDTGLTALAAGVESSAQALRDYILSCTQRGMRVAAYGAGSGVPPLLTLAGITGADLLAIGDASPVKHGRAMPVSRVPIISPTELEALAPDRVLVLVPGLLDEVRAALPLVESRGGRWVVLDPLPTEVL